jgi:CheY-like chemotaxis protein
MAAQFLWLTSSADQLATITLASYYTLIRLIQLITIRKPYQLTLNLRGPLVILDQLYLAALSLCGLPFYLTLPLSGLLLFMTRYLGTNYVYIAMPAAFFSILFTQIDSNAFLFDIATAIVISLTAVAVASLNTIWPLIKAKIRKQSHLSNFNPHKTETQDSEQNRHQKPYCQSPITEEPGLRILIISNSEKRLTLLSDHLDDWDYDYTTSSNSVQAFMHMLSRFQVNKFITYSILIVDQQGLDLDPLSLAQLIHDEPKLEGIRLICFKAPSALNQQSQQLYQAGYSALLETPLSKDQLFNALHGEHRFHSVSANIISLSEHRAIKKRKVNQETVLLADNASSSRTTLSKALIQAGYKVIMADDGGQVLDALEEQPISLAIINIKLPTMNGTQVFKLHRFTTPHKQWVPFVFLSDENNADTLRLCRSIGVQACFFKPVDTNDLLEMVPTLLTQHQARDSNLSYPPGSCYENNVTQFQNASLLDLMTLIRLERLDSGIAFINDLFKIFEAEGAVIIRTMRQAVEKKQLGLFLDQAQILLDSAGQLGAFALYELNRKATRLRAYEFEYRGNELLKEIEKTFHLTLEAYSHYLSQRAASLRNDSL